MAIQTKYQVTADVSSFDKAMANIRRQTATAASSAQKQFASLSKSVLSCTGSFGGLASAVAGGALLGGLTAAVGDGINKIVEFEKATSNLAGILSTTPAAVADLTEQAKMLGSTTAFTASQVTQLQTELAKLGFNQTEIQQSTDAVLKLSSATGAELGDAAALAGATLRAFKMDASEMARVTSVLAVSTTKSALDFSKLQTSMSIVSPVAKAFGFSIEDTVAMLGKLSDAGFDASSAATATRNILLNLANENGKLARSLGRPVKNAGELGAALAELRDKGVNLNEALAMTDKRSVAAFEAFMTQAEGIGKLSQELTGCNDALDTMVNTMTDNVQGSLDGLSSAWEGLMLSFSDSKGVIKSVIDGLTSLVRMLQTVVEGVDGAIQRLEMEGKANFDKTKSSPAEMKKRLEQQVTEVLRSNPGRDEAEVRRIVYEEERKRLEAEVKKTQSAAAGLDDLMAKVAEAPKKLGNGTVNKLTLAGVKEDEAHRLVRAYGADIADIIDGLKRERAELNIEAYAAQGNLQTYEKLTTPTQTTPAPAAMVAEEYNDDSIEGLRKHIQALKKERDGLNWKTDAQQITAYTGKIRELQDKLNDLTGTARKSSKATKEIGAEGSLSYAKAQLDEANKAFEMATDEAGREAAKMLMQRWGDAVRQMEAEPVKIDVEANIRKAQSVMDAAPVDTDAFGQTKGAENMYYEYSNYIDKLTAEFEALGAVIDNAFDAGAGGETLAPLMEQYDELSRHIEDAKGKADELNATVRQQNESKAALSEMQQGVGAIGTAFDAVGQFGNDTFKTMMSGFGEVIGAVGKLIPVLMAQSVASGTAKVASTSATWYEIIPGIAAVVGAITSMFASLKFAEGGVVGGSHYNADRVPALVQSGEMILNKRQQRNLFALLDGGTGGGTGGGSTSTMRLSGRDLVATIATQNRLTAKLK